MSEKEKPVLLFDGICNLCNSIVQFIIRRDPKEKFKFAALQSDAGQRLLSKYNIPNQQVDTFILITGEKYYSRSTAALHVAKILGRGWQLFYFFIIIPRPARDWIYQLIARTRYTIFGKRTTCMIPDEKLMTRFLK